jgi:iron(III) transport system ATP-binding protein
LASIEFERVSKRFPGEGGQAVQALDNVDLKVAPGELFFLLGPSGCGKTTALRVLAGFVIPDQGTVRIAGERMTRVPPHLRGTGMVFQHYALWPHLSVFENVAYGLRVRKLKREEIRTRAREALRMVQMEDRAEDRPGVLSGGQQQRIALARALAVRPRVLLLDEPLSNLDAKLRGEMRSEIKRLHEQTRITTIYVTHDQKEAVTLADRVALMNAGRVVQVGTPRELYCRPVSRWVAEFLGEANFLPGTVVGVNAWGEVEVFTALGVITASAPAAPVKKEQRVTLMIRPESFVIPGPEPRPGTVVHGRVMRKVFLGDQDEIVLRAEEGVVLRGLFRPAEVERIAEGEIAEFRLLPGAAAVIPE